MGKPLTHVKKAQFPNNNIIGPKTLWILWISNPNNSDFSWQSKICWKYLENN
jgi:hypothetical protein